MLGWALRPSVQGEGAGARLPGPTPLCRPPAGGKGLGHPVLSVLGFQLFTGKAGVTGEARRLEGQVRLAVLLEQGQWQVQESSHRLCLRTGFLGAPGRLQTRRQPRGWSGG